ncbi:hypothetical protein Chor_012082 [Crotalus horridus]
MGKKRRAVRCRKEDDSRDVEQSLCELRGCWGLHSDQLFADRKRYTSYSWVKYCNLRAKINPNRAAEACRHHLLLSWVAVSM